MSVIAYTHTHRGVLLYSSCKMAEQMHNTWNVCQFLFWGPCSTVKAAAAKSKRVGWGHLSSHQEIAKKNPEISRVHKKNLSMICAFLHLCSMLNVNHVF